MSSRRLPFKFRWCQIFFSTCRPCKFTALFLGSQPRSLITTSDWKFTCQGKCSLSFTNFCKLFQNFHEVFQSSTPKYNCSSSTRTLARGQQMVPLASRCSNEMNYGEKSKRSSTVVRKTCLFGQTLTKFLAHTKSRSLHVPKTEPYPRHQYAWKHPKVILSSIIPLFHMYILEKSQFLFLF